MVSEFRMHLVSEFRMCLVYELECAWFRFKLVNFPESKTKTKADGMVEHLDAARALATFLRETTISEAQDYCVKIR